MAEHKDEREELMEQWMQLELRRRGMRIQYMSELGACAEDQAWLDEYELIERQQEILELAIGAHEVLLDAEVERRPDGSTACRSTAQ